MDDYEYEWGHTSSLQASWCLTLLLGRPDICPKYAYYRGQMRKARGQALDLKRGILHRIQAQPGRVWTAVDLLDLGPRAAVDKALQRLATENTIDRIVRGLYFLTRQNALTGGPTVPHQAAIIDAVARRDQVRVVIDGLTAANDLGLTTAVPARVGQRTVPVSGKRRAGTRRRQRPKASEIKQGMMQELLTGRIRLV